jgi:hypothetical protein
MPLLLEELRIILESATPEVLSPVPKKPRAPGGRQIEKSPVTYTFNELPRLLNVVKIESEQDDFFLKAIRYSMSDTQTFLFGEEGSPESKSSIPAHQQMSSQCITAGNLFFDDEFENVIGINHDSGDFEPKMSTLIYSLKALLNTHLVPDEGMLEIKFRHPERFSIETEDATFNVAELRKMLSTIQIAPIAPIQQEAQQPAATPPGSPPRNVRQKLYPSFFPTQQQPETNTSTSPLNR